MSTYEVTNLSLLDAYTRYEQTFTRLTSKTSQAKLSKPYSHLKASHRHMEPNEAHVRSLSVEVVPMDDQPSLPQTRQVSQSSKDSMTLLTGQYNETGSAGFWLGPTMIP